jgi:hexokinase
LHEGNVLIEKGPVTQAIPVTRGVAFGRSEFLDILGRLLASLDPPSGLPLGYCFSYPADSTPDGDARLIKWTKGIGVENTIHEKVGRMLLDHLAGSTPPIECSSVTVINDTVASLLAGTVVKKAEGYIGLIVGTGNNMAAVLDPANIAKLPKELHWTALLPVNFESGNFTPPHLTTWDNKLDAASMNPGQRLGEKAVSGLYLATLLKVAMPESSFDPATGSKGVVDLAYHSKTSSNAERLLARQILIRSSQFVAASLAGVVMLLNGLRPRHSVCIVAEGSLFWGDPHYKTRTANTLNSLLEELGLGHINVDIVSVENANLVGSTVAALS